MEMACFRRRATQSAPIQGWIFRSFGNKRFLCRFTKTAIGAAAAKSH